MSTPLEIPPETASPPLARQAADIEHAVHAADGAVFFAERRVLRRVVKHALLSHLGLHVPDRAWFVIDRETLLQAANRDELFPLDAPLPETVYLLRRTESELALVLGLETVLLDYWRRVFRCRAEFTIRERFRMGEITDEGLRQRIDRIGQSEYDEVRAVLRSDDLVLPPRTEGAAYAVFVAQFWELRLFLPHRLPNFFPALRNLAAVEAAVAADLNALRCYEETRPEGAPDPASLDDPVEQPPEPVLDSIPEEEPRDDRRFQTFSAGAEAAAAQGNLVRAAVLHSKAARLTSRKRGAQAQSEARRNLEKLAGRLQAVLHLDQDDAQRLGASLRTLLERCPHNIWTPELRLLFDLQTVCVDLERDLYAVDPIEMVLSWGKRPLRRKVDAPRLVLACRHLRRAAKRVAAARITPQNRRNLTSLLEAALHRLEHEIRHDLGPRIEQAFDGTLALPQCQNGAFRAIARLFSLIWAPIQFLLRRGQSSSTSAAFSQTAADQSNNQRTRGMTPTSLPERVGRDKLVQELLDRIIEHGHIRFGDVRDAISRNSIKLEDLAGPTEIMGRDELLRIDRNLSYSIDGVYHRAEFYLRFFQKLSALLFATILGRLLTRFVLLPFGGAFMLVEFAKHLAEAIAGWFWVPEQHIAAYESVGGVLGIGATTAAATRVHLPFGEPYTFFLTGFFFLGLIHSRWFRRKVGHAFRMLGNAIAWVWRLTIRVLAKPLFQAIFKSRPALFIRRYVLKPALLGLLTAMVLSAAGVRAHESLRGGLAIFLVMNVLLNTRLGRDIEEIANEWLVRSWREFRTRVLAGIIRTIIDFFRAAVETVDRFLYAIDEWLRFRSGESQASLVFKAVAGSVWSLVTYVIRFSIILLVEPQINPIKHFPVVTVSHKLLLPTIPAFAGVLETVGYDAAFSYTLATMVIFGIPGIFGFLAWELKENWRLYEANRPQNLQTASIGHHGENVLRFLKPGIHSGTLPKLYRKLRRAEQSVSVRRRIAARKYQRQIAEARLALQHYLERELLALLHAAPRWPHRLQIQDVAVSTNNICVEIACPMLQGESAPPGPLVLRYDEQSGWLVASVAEQGWLALLQPDERALLRNAVVGLHHRSGTDLVREQIMESFARPGMSFDIADGDLVVWQTDGDAASVAYPLEASLLEPQSINRSSGTSPWPKFPPSQLLYKLNPVRWRDWVAAWEAAEKPEAPIPRLVPKVRVLPPLP